MSPLGAITLSFLQTRDSIPLGWKKLHDSEGNPFLLNHFTYVMKRRGSTEAIADVDQGTRRCKKIGGIISSKAFQDDLALTLKREEK